MHLEVALALGDLNFGRLLLDLLVGGDALFGQRLGAGEAARGQVELGLRDVQLLGGLGLQHVEFDGRRVDAGFELGHGLAGGDEIAPIDQHLGE